MTRIVASTQVALKTVAAILTEDSAGAAVVRDRIVALRDQVA
jgi:hypothetical protein